MWALLFFAAVSFVATAIYFIVKKRVILSNYLILNILRLIFLAILIWLATNPVFTINNTVTRNKKLYFLIDSSNSMNIKDAGAEKQSRIDAVNQLVFDKLLKKLKKRNIDIEITAFGDYPVKNPKTPIETSSSKSPIVSNIRDFFDRLKDTDPAGIFLFSDGQSTEPASPNSIEYPYPVNTVGCGNPDSQPDVIAESIDSPSLADLEQEVKFKIKTRKTKIADNTTLTMKMTDENGNVIDEKKSDTDEFVFSYTPSKIGLEKFKFEVFAEGLQEPYPANNTIETGLLVRKNLLKVTVIGVPSWDMSFFLRSLREIKNIKMSVYNVFANKKNEVFSVDKNEYVKMSDIIRNLPSQDALILSDTNADLFSMNDLEQLTGFVKNKGGGLLVFGGKRTLGSGNWQNCALKDIIPVELIENDFLAVSASVNFDKSAISHPILSGLTGRNDLAHLPPIYGLNVFHKIKPFAKTILSAKTDNGTNVAVFTVMNCGAGKSAVFSGRNFYKWSSQTKNDDSQTDFLPIFFKNVIGYIAASSEEAYISVNIPKINYSLGEKIPVEVMTLDRTYSPAKEALVTGYALSENSESTVLDFIPIAGDSAVFHCFFLPPQPGKYSIHIEGIRSKNDRSKAKTEVMVHLPTDEFKRIEANWDFLKQIAKESGGEFFDLDTFKTFADNLKPNSVTEKISVTKLVIDFPIVLIALLGIITSEWFLRIKNGLS